MLVDNAQHQIDNGAYKLLSGYLRSMSTMPKERIRVDKQGMRDNEATFFQISTLSQQRKKKLQYYRSG